MKSWMPLLTCMTAALTAVADASPHSKEWRFEVLLDEQPIGHHRFQLNGSTAALELISEARFNVKFLFLNAYRYVHDARERWQEHCLVEIAARTDDNGTQNTVSGRLTPEGFSLSVGERTQQLDHCVMTFAYWNPRILEATRLLNPQTGEYVPVRVQRLGEETLVVRGAAQRADRFRLIGDAAIGGPLIIDLWYSPRLQWLALESLTTDGRRLRYRLQ